MPSWCEGSKYSCDLLAPVRDNHYNVYPDWQPCEYSYSDTWYTVGRYDRLYPYWLA